MTKTEGESEREASCISCRDVSWLLFSDSSCSEGYSGLEMQKYSQKGRAGPAAPLARGLAFGSCPEVRYSVRRCFWPVQTGAPRQWSRGESRLLKPASRASLGPRPTAGFQPGSRVAQPLPARPCALARTRAARMRTDQASRRGRGSGKHSLRLRASLLGRLGTNSGSASRCPGCRGRVALRASLRRRVESPRARRGVGR